MDMSFMSKFRVQGRDAGRVLDQLSANDVDGEPGVITYTQWLNDGGTLEADLTVTKLDDDRFWVVASDTAHRHVADLDAPPHRRRARVRHRRDVGLRAAQRPGPALARAAAVAHLRRPVERGVPVPRPRARSTSASPACCASASPTSASSATSSTSRPSRPCTSTTGWSRPGAAFGLRHAGLKALASLRMEKGYRDYGHDIDNTDSVLEAGLGFAVDLDKPGGFIGRDAVLAQKAAGPLHPAAASRCCVDRPRAADVPRRGRAAATACRSATSARRPTATRSAARSAWR